MVMFCMMLAAAEGITRMQTWILGRFGNGSGIAAICAVFLWVVAEAYAPVSRQPVFVPPTELAGIATGPVLNLPVTLHDGYAELLQIFHHQPIATGFISRYSPAQVAHVDSLENIEGGNHLCEEAVRLGFRSIILEPVRQVEA